MKKVHNIKYYELIIYKEKHTSIIGVRVLTSMVLAEGIEPSQQSYTILSRARLPVPPRKHSYDYIKINQYNQLSSLYFDSNKLVSTSSASFSSITGKSLTLSMPK